ncbi:hypothetical protein OU416_22620 [Saccharopolyspora indica]|uniref:hypothetical protein n=1 Tax=Saccharopolyspora indica TaxID=1229659 RepID=UPI0022EABC04|nr:hypothetical protein [Saccharopolyspora indica]MDA3646867.1 hypothetical protein [Saccharopolyspora indica]
MTTLAALLLLGGAAVLVLHSSMTGYIEAHGLQACAAGRELADGCGTPQARADFRKGWSGLLMAGKVVVLALPVVLGVFCAAPLFAREIEHGTHVLAFTQSVSRFQWMITKVAVLLLPSAVVVVVLQFLVERWASAAGDLGSVVGNPFVFLSFDTTGPMPVAHLLFSFAAGAFLGVVARRSLMAMATTFGALIALRVLVSGVDMKFLPVQRMISHDPARSALSGSDELVVVRNGYLGPDGRDVPSSAVDLSACAPRPGVPEPDMGACYAQSGVTGQFADVIQGTAAPGLQLAEFAVFGFAAVLLLVGTAWALQRQH